MNVGFIGLGRMGSGMARRILGAGHDLTVFDASCFDGCYVTGDIDEYYLDAVEGKRGGKAGKNDEDGDGKASQQLVLGLAEGQD